MRDNTVKWKIQMCSLMILVNYKAIDGQLVDIDISNYIFKRDG